MFFLFEKANKQTDTQVVLLLKRFVCMTHRQEGKKRNNTSTTGSNKQPITEPATHAHTNTHTNLWIATFARLISLYHFRQHTNTVVKKYTYIGHYFYSLTTTVAHVFSLYFLLDGIFLPHNHRYKAFRILETRHTHTHTYLKTHVVWYHFVFVWYSIRIVNNNK